MRRKLLAYLAAVVGLGLAAASVSASQAETMAAWTQSSGATLAPSGYLGFCKTTPDECVARGPVSPQSMTPARWRELAEVNRLANLIIRPVSDEDNYHAPEVWALPRTAGDCEDYALLKRKWLEQRGWPTGSLLISVVFDEVGEGHAVLVARTSAGDFVLDNKTDELRRWRDTPYRFVKRQSVSDPNRWVMIGPAAPVDMLTAAKPR